ncbi:hypothetical protein Tco_0851694 [Tanacetum coccineum]
MHAPLRECFRDLPEADMKEILHNRLWESKSYQTHEDHMTLYEALEKYMARDNRDQLLSDLVKQAKRRKSDRAHLNHHGLSTPLPPLADEQAYSSSGEDVGRDHIPTVNLRQSWWKPITEDRPATPEPAWSIPSSDLTVPTNNWASALKSTYTPPQRNDYLLKSVIWHIHGTKLQKKESLN